jgi:D-alanine-D-alanine ligase
MNKDIKKVMLISGGISAEREISLISGKEVAKSLDRLGHKIIHVDANLNLLEKIEESKPDVIFNALHGTWGEDGQVQKILELSKTAYTHSGVKASKIAMDKHESAKIFIKNDILYPSTILSSLNDLKDNLPFKFPFIIKPRSEGSSVGVSIIRKVEDIEDYTARNRDRKEVLIQEFINGPEINVAVIGDSKTGSIEIDPKNDFYDYESKYFDDGETKHIIPARLSKDEIVQVEKLALKVHNLIGCKGISRTEFIYDKNQSKFYILEINTQPGMTPTSLVPEIAKFHGISFDELIDWILNDASTNR